MIVLFTDFGLAGPYTGQVKAVLAQAAPGVPVIDLFADAPAGKPKPSAYLLAAYAVWFPPGSVILAVVDPGVGSARGAVVAECDGRWYVGPENGLFELVRRRARDQRSWAIAPSAPALSASFHGRDLFAPAAAAIARGELPQSPPRPPESGRRPDWPDDLAEIVYLDHYGNAMTGLRAALLPAAARLEAGGRVLTRARTFSDVPPGTAFWYENANGLAEIAVNRARAAVALGLEIGNPVAVLA
ncbi:MAG TPA: SAM-dependent chlorinase/fluorinase [Stellaceae bacterium]|nr:SAM-dependent chlorinase/fluorinase [Stellaceae bacterium]